MIRIIFRTIGVTLLVGYLLAAGVIYGSWRQQPRYRGIKIDITYPTSDAHFVTEASIMQLVQSKPGFRCKGLPYLDVNTLELARYIEENNRLVRHVCCYHTPDSLLRIDVEQRDPVLRVKGEYNIKDSKGNPLRDFYIDSDGKLMPAQFGIAISLPLVTGYVNESLIIPLRDFAHYLKEDSFWRESVTQIHVRQNGDVELVPRVGDHTILLGALDNYETKLRHVRRFYDEVLPRRGWNTYRVINVKFRGQVIGEK